MRKATIETYGKEQPGYANRDRDGPSRSKTDGDALHENGRRVAENERSELKPVTSIGESGESSSSSSHRRFLSSSRIKGSQ